MWLKPGQRYLFGRVRKDGVLFAIDHKTVSRKHFIIEVDNVDDGDVGQVHARTRLKIVDQSSKSGTSVNGELLRSASRELSSVENSVRPGTCPHEIIIKWQPCVLTFNLLKKEIKSGVLKTKQTRVQQLDIKAIADFSPQSTTHVVANKRNTAKGLLALITGKHLVAESYIDALEYSATPQNISQEENLSRLETDFDSAWPDPKEHLPPPGKEPTIRPVELYQPDPSRCNIFEGYTFVFGDQTQYDNLMPVITAGHGKAISFKVSNNETTANELIQFLQGAAGNKPNGELRNLADAKVILVRWQGKDDVHEWTNNLINETALKTDQRAIDQSEFLDAILANDAALLQQSVPFESTSDGKIAPPPSAANSLAAREPSEPMSNGRAVSQRSNRAQQAPETSEQVRAASASQAVSEPVVEALPSQTSERNVSQVSSKAESAPRPFSGPRFTQKSGFRNFDDEFDPDAIIDYEGDDNDEEDVPSPDNHIKSQAQHTKIKEEPQSTTKKRRHSPVPDAENAFADEIDDLIPAAAAFKRQKLGAGQATGQNGRIEAQTRRNQAKNGKKENDIDVREVVKAQREEKEKAALKEQEQLEELGEIEDKAPANLVTVVTMDMPLRERSKNISRPNGSHGPEWDAKWNGRKNFKGFRRKGEAPQRRGQANKVIVPLVEVKMQSHGLGEQYWPKDAEERELEREQKRKSEARSQRTQSQTQRSSGRSRVRILSDEEDDDGNGDEPGDDVATQTSPATSRLQREAAEILDHEVNLDTPRRTRAEDKSQAASSRASGNDATQRWSQTQTAGTQSSSKRAAGTIANTRETKRQKTLPVTVVRGSDDDDDDSDDMKFRFGTRARRGRAGTRGKS